MKNPISDTWHTEIRTCAPKLHILSVMYTLILMISFFAMQSHTSEGHEDICSLTVAQNRQPLPFQPVVFEEKLLPFEKSQNWNQETFLLSSKCDKIEANWFGFLSL